MTSVKPPIEEASMKQPGGSRSGSRLLQATIAVLGVVVIALGAWLVYDQTTQASVPADVEQVFSDYLTAVEEEDDVAFRAIATGDFVFLEYTYTRGADRQDLEKASFDYTVTLDIEGFAAAVRRGGWQINHSGEPIIRGDGPWFVSVEESWVRGSNHYDGVASYIIVDEGGSPKIANHYWTGLYTMVLE